MATYFFVTQLTVEERLRLKQLFHNKYEKISDCHIWKGPCTTNGYGIFRCSFRGKKIKIRAHRAIYYLHFNHVMSSKLHVSHLCHNKLCVNVNHLNYEPQSVNNNRQRCVLGRYIYWPLWLFRLQDLR